MSKSSPLSLRVRPELLREIRKEAARTARRTSQVIQSTLDEGVRTRRCPGIIFTEGPAGRRATVAGTGIDVWEVIRVYKSCDNSPKLLARALPQLSRPQLEAAIYYYQCYGSDIEARLTSEAEAQDELAFQPFVRSLKV